MEQTKICRYCGNVVYKDEQTCQYCGNYLFKEHDNPELFCKKCKAPVNTDDNFCQACGAMFNLPPEDIVKERSERHNMAGIPYNIGILLTSFVISIAITVINTLGKGTPIGEIFVLWGISFVAAEILMYIYFLPSIIAIENNNSNGYFIYVCNLFLGVTVVGWILALVLALNSKQKS